MPPRRSKNAVVDDDVLERDIGAKSNVFTVKTFRKALAEDQKRLQASEPKASEALLNQEHRNSNINISRVPGSEKPFKTFKEVPVSLGELVSCPSCINLALWAIK